MGTTTETVQFNKATWAAAIMEPFEKSLVFGQNAVVNTYYEGSITRQGDTVHIGRIATPTVRKYDASADLEVEDLTVTDTALVVDQGDYFAFRVEDVTALMSGAPLQDPATAQAATALRDGVDRYIASVAKKDATTKLGALKVVDDKPELAGTGQTTAYKTLVKLGEKLNLQSVPTTGRYVIVSGEFHSALLMDDRFSRVDASGSEDGLRHGIVGRAAGFDVLLSNNLPTSGGKTTIVAGVPNAINLATALTKIEATREEKRFASIVKGLVVYGAKVTRPEGLVTAEVTVEAPAKA